MISAAQRPAWVSDDNDRVENEYLSRLRTGRLTGIAVPVHVGRRMIVLQISIYRPDEKLAAMMIQPQMVLPRESATTSGEGGGEA
jgi:acyl-coenzyme A thioesterase PaaI-like protein